MGKRKEPETVKSFVMKNIDISTNVGLQTVDLHCELVKYYYSDLTTLFERVFLGYKDYGYRLEIEPTNPIRENRDKDYLDGFSDEGNDATYSTSLGLGIISKDNPENTSDAYLKTKVFDWIRGFDPNRERGRRKDDWTAKGLFRKRSYDPEMAFEIYANIYPFHGSELSGYTDILSFQIANDDEDGMIFKVCIWGITFRLSHYPLYLWLSKKLVKNKPKWDRDVPWNEYNKLRTQWEKNYPKEAFFNDGFLFELGVNRAEGFFLKNEKKYSSGLSKSFNPWRNKLWRLI